MESRTLKEQKKHHTLIGSREKKLATRKNVSKKT